MTGNYHNEETRARQMSYGCPWSLGKLRECRDVGLQNRGLGVRVPPLLPRLPPARSIRKKRVGPAQALEFWRDALMTGCVQPTSINAKLCIFHDRFSGLAPIDSSATRSRKDFRASPAARSLPKRFASPGSRLPGRANSPAATLEP